MRAAYFIAILLLWLGSPVAAAPPFVDGAWLEKQQAAANLVIVDMSDDDTQYLRFHIPGAVRLPYDVLVRERRADPPAAAKPAPGAPPPTIKVPLGDAELVRVLGRLGIARDSHVVIYDDLGGLNAARLFWELERIGHPEVSVLDGGLVRWILDGRRVVNSAAPRKPVTYVAGAGGRANEARLREVRQAAGKNSALLLDVRTEEEYVGAPKDPRSGHIPGARLWPWDVAVDFDNGFVRRDQALLRQALARVGATPERPVIAYCRSGHRAAHTYLTLRALGFDDVRVYANSMNEYQLAPEAPLRRGREP